MPSLKTLLFRGTAAAALALSLSACAARQEASTIADARASEVDRYLQIRDQLSQTQPTSKNVRMKDDIWVGDAGFKSHNGEPLPAKFEQPKGISISSAKPLTLVEIASRINEMTGLPVRDAEVVMAWDVTSDPGNTQQINAGTPMAPGGIGQPMQDSVSDPFAGAFGPDTAPVNSYFTVGTEMFPPLQLNWSGSLTGLLNYVANFYGIDWEYRNGAIRFIGAQTKTYTLYALNTKTKASATINASAQGGGNTGESGSTEASTEQSGEVSIDLDYWSKVEDVVKSMLPATAKFAVNRDTGTITVTGRAAVLRRVDEYVREENRRLSSQVAISVKVLNVTLDNADSYNFDVGAVFRQFNDGIGAVIKSPASIVAEGAAGLAFNVLSDADAGIGDTRLARQFNGSSAAIQALSRVGKVSLVTTSQVTTLNNQTAPVAVTTQTGYLKKISVTTSDSGNTTELEPGTINAGFSMNVTPRIFTNGEVVMNYAITLSELTKLAEFSSGGNKIQIPEVNSRSFMQSVRMSSGDTLVLSGFERTQNAVENTGVGHPMNWLLGGGTNAGNKREILVVLVTPVVLGNNAAIDATK